MSSFLKLSETGFLLSVLLFGCGKKEEAVQPAPTPAVTSLTLESLTPAAGAKVSRTSTLTAQLKYSLAASETSADGYRVAIQFAMPNSSSTFAVGPGTVNLTARQGTLTVQYPLDQIWDRATLAHPITCYYYLQRVTGTGSTVIAKTAAQTFTE